jgi:hypothetical protein
MKKMTKTRAIMVSAQIWQVLFQSGVTTPAMSRGQGFEPAVAGCGFFR